MQLYDGATVTQLPDPLGNADANEASELARTSNKFRERGRTQNKEPLLKKKKTLRSKNIPGIYARERAHKKRHLKRREKKKTFERKKNIYPVCSVTMFLRGAGQRPAPAPKQRSRQVVLGNPLSATKQPLQSPPQPRFRKIRSLFATHHAHHVAETAKQVREKVDEEWGERDTPELQTERSAIRTEHRSRPQERDTNTFIR